MEEGPQQTSTIDFSAVKSDKLETSNNEITETQKNISITTQIISTLTESQKPSEISNENNLTNGGTSQIESESNDTNQPPSNDELTNTESNEDKENTETNFETKNDIENESKVNNETNSETKNDTENDSTVNIEEITGEISDVLITNLNEPHVALENSDTNNDNIQEDQNTEQPKDDTTNIEDQIDNIIKTQKVPSDQSRYEILSYVKKVQVDKMVESDYIAASRYHNCELIIQNQIYLDERSYSENYRRRALDTRLENLKKNRERVEKDWDEKFDQYQQEADKRQQKLDETHREELQKFEEKWESSDNLKHYNKASPSLLQLRKIEKIQALAKEYEAASHTKSIADDLQKKEEEETEKILITTMRKQYNIMISKQKNERECAQENWDRHKRFIQLQKEKQLKQIDQAAQQLELRRSQPSFYSHPYKTSIIAPTLKSRPTTAKTMRVSSNHVISRPIPQENLSTEFEKGSETDSLNMNSGISNRSVMANTPRTRKSIADFKSQPTETRLNLTGISMSQLQKRNTNKYPFHPRMTKRYRNLG